MTTAVSFEIAKLLKEKGFDKACNYYYELEYAHLYPDNNIHIWDRELEVKFKNLYQKGKAAAPTISQVIIWLYEKHGFWIQPFPYDTITAAKEWTVTVLSLEWGEDKEVHYENKIGGFNSPTEAYEAAIEYTLKNLI